MSTDRSSGVAGAAELADVADVADVEGLAPFESPPQAATTATSRRTAHWYRNRETYIGPHPLDSPPHRAVEKLLGAAAPSPISSGWFGTVAGGGVRSNRRCSVAQLRQRRGARLACASALALALIATLA